jgi:chromosome segregation ATPase
MDDAPEWTPRWIGVPEEKYEELKAKVAALERERDELDAHLMETLDQLDDCKLGLIDCLKSRSFELRQAEAEVERLRTEIREAAAPQAWADKRRREWDADAKSAFLNWERGR